jgi:hypothetical protein
MRLFSLIFCSIRDFDESNHKLFNLHFSIKLIGRINCDKRVFVGVNGVRARFPSFIIKLFRDFDIDC